MFKKRRKSERYYYFLINYPGDTGYKVYIDEYSPIYGKGKLCKKDTIRQEDVLVSNNVSCYLIDRVHIIMLMYFLLQ